MSLPERPLFNSIQKLLCNFLQTFWSLLLWSWSFTFSQLPVRAVEHPMEAATDVLLNSSNACDLNTERKLLHRKSEKSNPFYFNERLNLYFRRTCYRLLNMSGSSHLNLSLFGATICIMS